LPGSISEISRSRPSCDRAWSRIAAAAGDLVLGRALDVLHEDAAAAERIGVDRGEPIEVGVAERPENEPVGREVVWCGARLGHGGLG
jgi:hypothetical protein